MEAESINNFSRATEIYGGERPFFRRAFLEHFHRDSRGVMDVYDGEYYNIIKLLLSLIGLWPTQTHSTKILLRSVVFFFLISFQITQISKLLTTKLNMDLAIKIIGPEIIALVTAVKYLVLLFHYEKIHALIQHMKDDWEILDTKEEIKILKSYTLGGKRFIRFYTLYVFSSVILFIFASLIPCIMDALSPSNNSRVYEHPYVAEYFVDEQQYFYSILLHMIGCILVGHVASVANEGIYITYLQHVCGMLNILGNQLEYVCLDNKVDYKQDDIAHRKIVRSMQFHQRILRFVKTINNCFGWSWLIQITLGFFIISTVLFQIATQLDEWQKTVMYGNFALAGFAYFFFIIYPGQKLINHSTVLIEKIYESEWYLTSVNIRRLILMIMRKCKYPCTLNAGKFYILSFETFGAIVHLSLSYFTMLYSVQ